MCKLKSAIILKDRVFMPDYDSHDKMLEELGIKDTRKNAEKLFVRAELSPKTDGIDGAFTDVDSWVFTVDQDVLPEWYVREVDEQRMREAVKEWVKTHIFVGVNGLNISSGEGYYIKDCKQVVIGGSAAVKTIGGYATVKRICESATVDNISGSATVNYISNFATVERISDSATVKDISDSATVENISGSATVENICESATVESICDSAKVGRICGFATVGKIVGSATVDYIGDSAIVKNIFDFATVNYICDSSIVACYQKIDCIIKNRALLICREEHKIYVSETGDWILTKKRIESVPERKI